MSSLYSPTIIKDKILMNVSVAIREIHRLCVVDDDDEDDREEQTAQRVTNDHWQVHCLLEHLDFALLYGLKYVQDGYYKCVSEFSPKQLTDQIAALYNIETDIGRGRAWLFLALNDNLTESYMKCFQDNRKLVKQFYTTDSLVSDTPRLIALSTICSGLETIQFDLATDCNYFDRGCWPAYLQQHLKDTENQSSSGGRNRSSSFTNYLSRYDTEHIPSLLAKANQSAVLPKRVRQSKRTGRTSRTPSIANDVASSDNAPVTSSRSSSISFDNPSMDASSLNEDNQIPICVPITTDSPVPIPVLSSSLSELDPILNSRPRTPSPIPSPMVEEQIMTNVTDEQVMTNSIDETLSLTETIQREISLPADEQVMTNSIDETSSLAEPTQRETSLPADEQPPPIEKQLSVSVEDSLNMSEKNESSLSMSMSNGFNELSIEKKNEDLVQLLEEDPIDLPADANLQLQCTLELYEMPNDEEMIKLFPTNLSHNTGNIEMIFVLITTMNIYLLRQINEINGSYRLDKIESTRLAQIDYIEIGPNEQFLRGITVKHTKLHSLTTGCVELTRAICASICKAARINRLPEPQLSPATMQELSIKKELARDMKKSSAQDVKLLDYHYTFWEEPQMSGRKLRKEGYLFVKLNEQANTIRRIGAAALKLQRHGFETGRNGYVTLRIDRLNIYLHKSDMNPALSYTLLDENCQGCRRNRNADQPHALEIIFANDVTLVMSAKSKTEQDEWLNAIMKGLSQGHMSTKDEENTANTIPCSVMLTDEKLYVCHDEQDNSLIRQLDSIKLEYVARLFVDPHYQYYCVVSIEHGIQGAKSWIFYFLFAKEMIRFVKNLQKALSDIYQVSFDIQTLDDVSFQNECERTSKRLLRSYRPATLTS